MAVFDLILYNQIHVLLVSCAFALKTNFCVDVYK